MFLCFSIASGTVPEFLAGCIRVGFVMKDEEKDNNEPIHDNCTVSAKGP